MWINLFATSLKPKGRAALVMANSASDARHSEADIRKTLIENNLIYGMLTLPSNMFYTVTLPATLWFFDKDKQDENILFIDARNIFNQIDRAHREFTEEQTHNISIISQLHRGNRKRFTELVNSYFSKGETKLTESHDRVEPVAAQIEEVMTSAEGKAALKRLLVQWESYTQVQQATKAYQSSYSATSVVEQQNQAQHSLTAAVTPFFEGLHGSLKQLDKAVRTQEKQAALDGKRTDRDMKALKTSLEEIHKEVKEAESFFAHIRWLQERFPQAKYEDVTGLCKLANMAEVKEQDYSLNPGRYVGVVIEEDGKTEEEFIAEILDLNDELEKFNSEARELESVITHNVRVLVGDA
jgi:type I restriction enzyme M protein